MIYTQDLFNLKGDYWPFVIKIADEMFQSKKLTEFMVRNLVFPAMYLKGGRRKYG